MNPQLSTDPLHAAAATLQASAAHPVLPAISEWLTFRIGGEEYGIDILSVQEIRSYEKPTRIVKGVINLRGVIVPVVDMRIRFGLEDVRYDDFTVVIVLLIGQQTIGMVIDSVSDVTTLTPAEVRPTPPMQGLGGEDEMIGIASIGPRTLLLLDVQKMMRAPDIGVVIDGVLQ